MMTRVVMDAHHHHQTRADRRQRDRARAQPCSRSVRSPHTHSRPARADRPSSLRGAQSARADLDASAPCALDPHSKVERTQRRRPTGSDSAPSAPEGLRNGLDERGSAAGYPAGDRTRRSKAPDGSAPPCARCRLGGARSGCRSRSGRPCPPRKRQRDALSPKAHAPLCPSMQR